MRRETMQRRASHNDQTTNYKLIKLKKQMKQKFTLSWLALTMTLLLFGGGIKSWGTDITGSLTFGTNDTKINNT
jgi:hypothetical protein